MKVTLQDAIVLGYCRRGCRAFAETHGLSWSEFRSDGLDSTLFEDIDDEMCRQFIAEAARREGALNGQQ